MAFAVDARDIGTGIAESRVDKVETEIDISALLI